MNISDLSTERLATHIDKIESRFKAIKEWDDHTHILWKRVENRYFILKFWHKQKTREYINSLKPTFDVNNAEQMREIYYKDINRRHSNE